ncbi:MAG: DUF4254 domain-containing protein [Mucinivorans sp.]
MKFTELCNQIFTQVINEYHLYDDIDYPMPRPYAEGSLEMLLFHKSWIDTVQWHLEDIIREPSINPIEALKIKRRIDASNQERTDKVEFIDGYFLDKYKDVRLKENATLNTETIAWAVDRYSILLLKIHHMAIEAHRNVANAPKLKVLLEQQKDMVSSIEQLICDIENGTKEIKIYKQMKMYNDPALNPVLYAKKN